MSCSWTRVSIWVRTGSACTRTRILSGITSSQAGTVRSPASARATTNGVISTDFALTCTMSFSLTRYEGMSTLGPFLAVLAQRVRPELDRALRRVALGAFQEQLGLLAAAALAVRTGVSSHVCRLLLRPGAAWAGGSHCAEPV